MSWAMILCKSEQEIKNSATWTPVEESALIYFLKDNIDFEKPTAQIFYERFLQNSAVRGDWNMVRSKVFDMQTTYNKTKDWLNNLEIAKTDKGLIENDIHKMCPFYYEFEEIFGSHLYNTSENVNTFKSISNQTSDKVFNTIVKSENEKNEHVNDDLPTTYDDRSFFDPLPLQNPIINQYIGDVADNLTITICKEDCLRSSVLEILQKQREFLKFREKTLHIHSSLRERKMDLIEREIAVQEKKLELKEKILKNQERLQLLELEMNERLSMMELELKYKN